MCRHTNSSAGRTVKWMVFGESSAHWVQSNGSYRSRAQCCFRGKYITVGFSTPDCVPLKIPWLYSWHTLFKHSRDVTIIPLLLHVTSTPAWYPLFSCLLLISNQILLLFLLFFLTMPLYSVVTRTQQKTSTFQNYILDLTIHNIQLSVLKFQCCVRRDVCDGKAWLIH